MLLHQLYIKYVLKYIKEVTDIESAPGLKAEAGL